MSVSVPNRDRRLVDLRLGVEKGGEPGRATDQKNQKSGRKRIERAEMSDAALAVNPSHVLNDIVRRHPGGLVDEEQSLGLAGDLRAVSRSVVVVVHAPESGVLLCLTSASSDSMRAARATLSSSLN